MENSQESQTITYQDILAVRASLRELKSWHETLYFMTHFLDGNQTRTSSEIQACSEIFEVVYQNFGALLTKTEVSLNKIVKSK